MTEQKDQTEAAGVASELTQMLGLKPCPFCGSTNISSGEVMGERPDGTLYKQTGCLDCEAEGPTVACTDIYDEVPCNEAWNRRAPNLNSTT